MKIVFGLILLIIVAMLTFFARKEQMEREAAIRAEQQMAIANLTLAAIEYEGEVNRAILQAEHDYQMAVNQYNHAVNEHNRAVEAHHRALQEFQHSLQYPSSTGY